MEQYCSRSHRYLTVYINRYTGLHSTSHSSGSSEVDLTLDMDHRKRKRMESNRESARRSRLRKQKHLDDLSSRAAHLRSVNNQILEGINVSTGHFLKIEAENSVLRAQATELSHRLESLNEILGYICCSTTDGGVPNSEEGFETGFDGGVPINVDPFSLAYVSQPPDCSCTS